MASVIHQTAISAAAAPARWPARGRPAGVGARRRRAKARGPAKRPTWRTREAEPPPAPSSAKPALSQASLDAQRLDLLVEGVAVDAQQLGGADLVAARLAQRHLDERQLVGRQG